MQSKDIPDSKVMEYAQNWADNPFTSPGVVQALVNDGVPEKLARVKVEKLVDKGMLDYGTSSYYAWPNNTYGGE